MAEIYKQLVNYKAAASADLIVTQSGEIHILKLQLKILLNFSHPVN